MAGAAAFGPPWLVRIGVVVAIAAAAAAWLGWWREGHAARRRHARAMLAAGIAHREVLQAERQRNTAVLDVLTARARAAGTALERQARTVDRLRAEVAGLRADRGRLTAQVSDREATVAALGVTVRAREAELAELAELAEREANGPGKGRDRRAKPQTSAGNSEADVHAMPRRLRSESGSRRASPSPVAELRPTETAMDRPAPGAPDTLHPGAPAGALVTPQQVAMPNYEDDRRFG